MLMLYHTVTDNFEGTFWSGVLYRFWSSRIASLCCKILFAVMCLGLQIVPPWGMMDFGGIFVQVSRMSLWNYGTEVMDALVELITSLVHDFFFFFVSPLDLCNYRTNCQILLSLMVVYLSAGCFQWEIHWLVFGDACETFCAPFLPLWFSEKWEWDTQEK